MQGLEWVLSMYAAGACPDYRFTYDAHGPPAPLLISALGSDTSSNSSGSNGAPVEDDAAAEAMEAAAAAERPAVAGAVNAGIYAVSASAPGIYKCFHAVCVCMHMKERRPSLS